MGKFDNYLFRCSSLYKLMTEPQSKEAKLAGELSATTKTELKKIYKEEVYKRRDEFSSKFIEKGITQEENAITLFSRYKNTFYKKNKKRLNNQFITGEPDLFKGKEIDKCEEGFDIKCSWSIFTFPDTEDGLNKQYEYQNHGYIELTGADQWTTAYCLVNAPANLVLNEKKSIWYALGCPEEDNELYVAKCIEVEKNMIFNMEEFLKVDPYFDFHCQSWEYDIPIDERVIEFTTVRNEDCMNAYRDKVIRSREVLNKKCKTPELLLTA